jgi:hypothetical protein
MRGRVAALLVSAGLFLPGAAAAITVDGQLDPAYGPAIVTQTTQTELNGGQIAGDSNVGDLAYANGSELDAGHAVIAGGVLHLFLGGNLALMLTVNQNQSVGHSLALFIDSAPGGQNALNGLGAGHPLNGLTFDAGFEADHWFEFSGEYEQGPIVWSAGRAALLNGGGGTLVHLGTGSAGTGTLSGGTNPHGILATLDNRNVGGVTFGCNASSGAGVTTGIEWAIPLAAIGNPEGCVRITAIVWNSGSSQGHVSNSVLGPVPPGTCALGPAASVNLANIASDQFFSVCPPSTDVPERTPAGFGLRFAGANPSSGGRVAFAFELPNADPASLRMLDCSGRVVRERAVRGSGAVDLAEGGRLRPGIYWVQLTQGTAGIVRKLSIVP